MAANRLTSILRKPMLNSYKSGINFHLRCCQTRSEVTEIPKHSWKFLIFAFGVPGGSFLFYKMIIEPSSHGLTEEEAQLPFITRFMMKYFMEDPIENKRKIHEHIRICREVADKRLAWINQKQKPIAPGKFQELIQQEKQNIAYDSEMH